MTGWGDGMGRCSACLDGSTIEISSRVEPGPTGSENSDSPVQLQGERELVREICAAHENKTNARKSGVAMLNRWDPFAEINRLQDQFRRAQDNGERASFAPAVNIFEDKEGIHLTAEVPGMKPEEVHVDVENRVLTISGERKLEKSEQKDGYHRIERSYGKFTRSFTLPDSVDGEKIVANLKDGVLAVRLPKRAVAQTKKISVNGS